MRFDRISILVLLGLIGGGTLPAQTPPALPGAPATEPPPTFGESVEVRVVNVEVVVTDRDGDPVADLERGDFRLEVDGKPVEITHFARLGEVAAAPAPVEPLSTASPSAPSPESPAPAANPEESRLRLAVWVDDLHTIPAHRNRVLRELGDLLLEREQAGADLLLVRYDRKFELVRGFGKHSRPLADDLQALSKKAASGVFVDAARRSAFEEIETIYANDQCTRVDDMRAAAERYAGPLEHDSRLSLGALRAMIKALSGLPGRKALLFVTDGLPLIPGQEAHLYVDQLCADTTASQPKATLVGDLRQVSAEANAAGVTFYTFGAGGLPVGGGAALQGRGLDFVNESAARANFLDPLHQLAAETGGRALLEANKLDPLLEGLARDMDSAYSLGFTPSGERSGKEHRIVVRVVREGVRVRHREAFRDRTVEEERDGRLVSALSFGGGGNPHGVALEIAAAKPLDRGTSLLPVKVAVPAKSILFLGATPEAATARLELSFAAVDPEGDLSPIQTRALTIDRARLANAPPDVRLRFPIDLRVRKGPTRVAAIVRDLQAQTESLVWAEVAVE